MKKLTIILSIFFVASIFFLTDLKGQNFIPSNCVELNQNNMTFIEDSGQNPNMLEERKVNVVVEDQRPDQILPVTVILYSNDGTTELGPYTVSENSPLEVDIDAAEWSVQVISYTAGTEMSVWIE